MSSANQSWNPENFLTRSEKMKKFSMPPNTSKSVIILGNEEGIGFRFNCYNPEILSPYVDKATFDSTVLNCHKICEMAWIMLKNEGNKQHNLHDKIIGGFAGLLAFISLILFCIEAYGPQPISILAIAVILIGIAVIIVFVLSIKAILLKYKYIEYEPYCYEKIATYLENENKKVYLHRNLEWKIGQRFYYLELKVNESNVNTYPDIGIKDAPRKKEF